MPKAKLKLSADFQDRLQVAAQITDVKLLDGKKFGNTIVAEVGFRTPSELFELGREVASLPSDTKYVADVPKEVVATAAKTAKK